MKNFKKIWEKRKKTPLGKATIVCYIHLPTNNLLYSHSEKWNDGKFWHTWTNNISETNEPASSATLKFWIDYFFKHPVTLGK